VVVGDPPQLKRSVVVEEGVGGPLVAVERHPDAPGIDQFDAVGAGTPELQVRVPEHDPPLADAAEEDVVILAGTREERAHVGHR
jgi:hypothetical protein